MFSGQFAYIAGLEDVLGVVLGVAEQSFELLQREVYHRVNVNGTCKIFRVVHLESVYLFNFGELGDEPFA